MTTEPRQERFKARTERRDPGCARLTPRDKLLLHLVARCLTVHTGHIERFLGVSSAVARRRSRTLKNLGLLTCFVPAPYLPNWFAITPKAKEQLVLTLVGEPEDYRVLRGLPRHLDHHAMLVDVFIGASLAAARSNRLHLAECLLEWEIRAALGSLGARSDIQVPDLTLVVENAQGQRLAFAIEVDLGTVSPNVMASRLLAYAQARLAGQPLRQVPDWGVLVVCPSVRRRNRLALRFHDEAGAVPEGFVHLAVVDELTERNFFLAEPWRSEQSQPDGTARLVAMSPFAALTKWSVPCSAGRSDTPSACQNTSSPPGSARSNAFYESAEREQALVGLGEIL